jgi:hypothetical protein
VPGTACPGELLKALLKVHVFILDKIGQNVDFVAAGNVRAELYARDHGEPGECPGRLEGLGQPLGGIVVRYCDGFKSSPGHESD